MVSFHTITWHKPCNSFNKVNRSYSKPNTLFQSFRQGSSLLSTENEVKKLCITYAEKVSQLSRDKRTQIAARLKLEELIKKKVRAYLKWRQTKGL